MLYLCCDLGASSADWGILNSTNNHLITASFSLEFESFADMMENKVLDWIANSVPGQTLSATCIAVAGRIEDGQARMTNGERWIVNSDKVGEILNARGHSGSVTLLNDFEALSLGVAALLENEERANSTERVHGSFLHTSPARRVLVCGPGTGLGVAMLMLGTANGAPATVISSEGGHHSLAPESSHQRRFEETFARENPNVSYEDALSKEGLRNLYNFLRKEQGLQQKFDIDPYEIIHRSKSDQDVQATDAVALFCEILANFCGNLCLTFNIDRGVFLWGGVLKEMSLPLLQSRFRNGFGERAMHGDKVREIPVVLLSNKDVPLYGCAARCRSGD